MSKDTYVFDLDGTICWRSTPPDYLEGKPNIDLIVLINELWTLGHKIVIFTARGMNTYNGKVSEIETALRDRTELWLEKNRVMYDELIFGKPSATFYIDDKAITPQDFIYKIKRSLHGSS